jgi:cell wall-associated NlpC family hydrolase
MGTEVPEASTQPGDVILFTGTDHNIRTVGHIGIVVSNLNGDVSFVHATSGTASAVTISRLQETYKSRFVKIIRLLQEP